MLLFSVLIIIFLLFVCVLIFLLSFGMTLVRVIGECDLDIDSIEKQQMIYGTFSIKESKSLISLCKTQKKPPRVVKHLPSFLTF